LDAAAFTRVMPLASSGATSPLSPASTANFRTAVILTLMDTAPQPSGFQGHAPSAHSRLGEARTPLLNVPGEELVKAEVVHPFRNREGYGIEDRRNNREELAWLLLLY
jgi:hypothetical protein